MAQEPPLPGLGKMISGFYTFDPATPGEPQPGASLPLAISYVNTITDFRFSSGSYSGRFGAYQSVGWSQFPPYNNITITNTKTSDRYNFNLSFAGPNINGFRPGLFEIMLDDDTGTPFNSFDLPIDPPNLGSFAAKQINVWFRAVSGDAKIASYSLTSLTVRQNNFMERFVGIAAVIAIIAGLFAIRGKPKK